MATFQKRGVGETMSNEEIRIKALEDLAVKLWMDYGEHDLDCCAERRPDLMTEILEKRQSFRKND